MYILISWFLVVMMCSGAAPVDPLAMLSMIPGFPGIWDMMRRQPSGGDSEMERLTLAPIVRMNISKTILNEIRVPDITTDIDNIVVNVTSGTQKKMVKISFLQANPFYLRNSGDVTMPLRRPPQAYVNVAVRENVAGTQGAKLIFEQKREAEKLRIKNNELMMKMLKKANITARP